MFCCSVNVRSNVRKQVLDLQAMFECSQFLGVRTSAGKGGEERSFANIVSDALTLPLVYTLLKNEHYIEIIRK